MGLLIPKDNEIVRIEFNTATFEKDCDEFRTAYTRIARKGLMRNFATALNYRKHHLMSIESKAIEQNRLSVSIEWDF